MSYLLQFPAATAYVVTGRLILGTGYSISFELQRDSDVDIYLSSDGGDELRYLVGIGWQLKSGSTYTYPEAELIPPIGTKFTVTFARDGGTTNRSVQLNGGAPVSKVTGAFNLWVNNIGQGAGGVYRAFKLYKCTVTNPSNTTYSRVFDADASGGTGTILPNTLTGTNNGTLTGAGWPSDDSEWIFYSSGAIDSAIAFSMPQMTVAVAASKTVPVVSASVAFSMPQMSVAVSATNAAAGVSASVAFTMPQMSVSVAASKTVPTFSSAISFTMPQMQVTASASKTVPTFTATIAATMPQMTVSATGRSGDGAIIAFTMPQMRIDVIAEVPLPQEPERSLYAPDNKRWQNSIFFNNTYR